MASIRYVKYIITLRKGEDGAKTNLSLGFVSGSALFVLLEFAGFMAEIFSSVLAVLVERLEGLVVLAVETGGLAVEGFEGSVAVGAAKGFPGAGGGVERGVGRVERLGEDGGALHFEDPGLTPVAGGHHFDQGGFKGVLRVEDAVEVFEGEGESVGGFAIEKDGLAEGLVAGFACGCGPAVGSDGAAGFGAVAAGGGALGFGSVGHFGSAPVRL